MMKTTCFLLCISAIPVAIGAEQRDSCAGLESSLLNECRNNQQSLRQLQLEQQLQQQQDRQNQLDQQQRDIQKQLQSMRAENDDLRKQLEREPSGQDARPIATGYKNADVKNWKADNPWFGSDYVRTQFAVRYLKQLQQERPDLGGRELLDALSTKVNATFAAKH